MIQFNDSFEVFDYLWQVVCHNRKPGEGFLQTAQPWAAQLTGTGVSTHLINLSMVIDQIPHRRELEALERLSGKPVLQSVAEALNLRQALMFGETELEDGEYIHSRPWLKGEVKYGPDSTGYNLVPQTFIPYKLRANIRRGPKHLLPARKMCRDFFLRDVRRFDLRRSKRGGVFLSPKIQIAGRNISDTIERSVALAQKHSETDVELKCPNLLYRRCVCTADILNWRVALDADALGVTDYNPGFTNHDVKMMAQASD